MLRIKTTVVLASAFAFAILSGCEDASNSKPSELRKLQSTMCSLDVMSGDGGMVAYTEGGTVNFAGWAADSNTNTTPPLLNVVLTGMDGKPFVFKGAARNDRPDVVKAFNQDVFLKSGFSINADISALQKGTYSVNLQMPTADNLITCETKKTLVLK